MDVEKQRRELIEGTPAGAASPGPVSRAISRIGAVAQPSDAARTPGDLADPALKLASRESDVVSKRSAFPVSRPGVVVPFPLTQNNIHRHGPRLRLAPAQADSGLPFGWSPPPLGGAA